MGFLKKLFDGGKVKTQLFEYPAPSGEAMERAESTLMIRFPRSYTAFVRNMPAMRLPLCAQFFSFGEQRPLLGDIVESNRFAHDEAASPLPPFLVAFYGDGMGNLICFDTRRCSGGDEYPIVFWDHELDTDENLVACDRVSEGPESAGRIAASFPEWLKLLDEMLN